MRFVNVIWLASVVLATVLPVAAVAASCSEIAVGAVLSLTGRHSTTGVLARDGYEFAVRQLRATGGIRVGNKCYNLRVVYRDDESSPERGILVALRLIEEDRIRFMLAPNDAAVADAVADLTEAAGIPMVAAQGMPNRSFAQGRRYLFGLLTASDRHLAAGLEFAAKLVREADRSKTQIGLAVLSANGPFMSDVHAGVVRQAASQQIKIVADEKLTDDFVNLPAIVSKVYRSEADVLLVAGHAKAAAIVAKQLQALSSRFAGAGSKPGPIVAMTHCEAANIAARAGDAAGRILCAARATETNHGQIAPLRDRAVFDKAFKVRFKAYADRAVPDAVPQAALAVYVLADALGRAGSRDNKKVRDALQATHLSTFFGRVTFTEAGYVVAVPMVWQQIQGGKYRIIAPAGVATHKYQSSRSGL